jgi:hypothetical protein
VQCSYYSMFAGACTACCDADHSNVRAGLM